MTRKELCEEFLAKAINKNCVTVNEGEQSVVIMKVTDIVDFMLKVVSKKRKINWNDLAKEIHDNAVKHGWWDEPRSFGYIVSLIHSELSEALEEDRADNPEVYFVDKDNLSINTDLSKWTQDKKLEGAATECADVIIRILDYLASRDQDIAKAIVNHDLEERKFPKMPFPDFIAYCHLALSNSFNTAGGSGTEIKGLIACFIMILDYYADSEVDIIDVLLKKHEFNKTREYKHGGKKY